MERLTAKRAETLRKPGRYQAGDTVYLVVARGRTGRVNKRWVQRLHVQGKRRDISIGTYPAVTLSEARERAHDNRLTAKRGGDPSGRASTVPTFADLSAKVDQGGQWCGSTRETRRRTLARYAARLMGRPVDQIDRAAVLSVLGPVYRDKPATGKLLRGWVRGVLAAAQALGHVDVNAAGEVIDAALLINDNYFCRRIASQFLLPKEGRSRPPREGPTTPLSVSCQPAPVLTAVKAHRYALPPLRGADGLDGSSAQARAISWPTGAQHDLYVEQLGAPSRGPSVRSS